MLVIYASYNYRNKLHTYYFADEVSATLNDFINNFKVIPTSQNINR